MPRETSRYRDKRSSSYSSTSSYERKKSRSKHKRRSRSRDRSESSSYRRRRSISKSKSRRRSYSRSVSRERYEKSRRRSSSRPKGKRSRHSRDRSQSRSSSHSRSKHSKSRKHKKRTRSSSRSSSYDIETKYASKCFINLDDTDTQVEKAIKAAEAAGLTLTKIPKYDYKDIEVKEDMPTIHDRNVLDDINSDSFVPKTFTSIKNKKQSQNIVIDLDAETIKVPRAEVKSKNEDSIINFDAIPNEEELKEMWIKKLYSFRKKMLKGEI